MQWIMVPLMLLWSFISFVAWLAGMAAHLITTYISFVAGGFWWALFAFATPVVSECYWLYKLYSIESDAFFPIAFFSGIWLVGKAIPFIFLAVCSFLSKD